MRYLIASDIHSNLEALEAVLASAAGEYDAVLVCGDLVGYGADPAAVVDWARERAMAVVRGNHDRALWNDTVLEWFNGPAREAALWSRAVLDDAALDYLCELPRGPLGLGGFHILHGAPHNEDAYVSSVRAAADCETQLPGAVSFFGHSHWQGGFRFLRGIVRPIAQVPASDCESVLQLYPHERYLINPGSVGQPRDGDTRAAYCLYMPGQGAVVYRRVPYDVAGAQRKIVAAGLPQVLATRLAEGR